MQTFVGYKLEIDSKTGREEKKWKETVANDRFDAARKMEVPVKTVTLQN